MTTDEPTETPKRKGVKPGTMTDEHKAALALGRDQGLKVKKYLEYVANNRPKRGRKRTVEKINAELLDVRRRILDADPLERLELVQKRLDLEAELNGSADPDDFAATEKAFIEVAKSYSQRKGISEAAWRELGVSTTVLRKAGIFSK